MEFPLQDQRTKKSRCDPIVRGDKREGSASAGAPRQAAWKQRTEAVPPVSLRGHLNVPSVGVTLKSSVLRKKHLPWMTCAAYEVHENRCSRRLL